MVIDPAWVNRRLLLLGANTLSRAGCARLERVLRTDDPTDELGAAWGIKEQVRRLLRTGSLADAHTEKMRLGAHVLAAKMPETDKLYDSICA